MFIAKDTILMLSGVSCVGKTTVAYEIIKNYPEFRRVSELDIIRTVVRTAFEHFEAEEGIRESQMVNKHKILFESLTNGSLETAKLQAKQLLPYVKEIILRQQRRKIPTVIEGAGIVPSVYFPDDQPLEWLTKNVVFVNLFLSNENDHIARRVLRSTEREYLEDIHETKTVISKARAQKNMALHSETIKLSQQFPNVFSIDIANISPAHLADIIINLVDRYFDSQLHT